MSTTIIPKISYHGDYQVLKLDSYICVSDLQHRTHWEFNDHTGLLFRYERDGGAGVIEEMDTLGYFETEFPHLAEALVKSSLGYEKARYIDGDEEDGYNFSVKHRKYGWYEVKLHADGEVYKETENGYDSFEGRILLGKIIVQLSSAAVDAVECGSEEYNVDVWDCFDEDGNSLGDKDLELSLSHVKTIEQAEEYLESLSEKYEVVRLDDQI